MIFLRCEKCGATITDTDEICPKCGTVNEGYKNPDPKTIDELVQWYIDSGLPPYNTTGYFIGINSAEPRTSGIYEEDEKYIVYENDYEGNRKIIYEGPYESLAVNKIFSRLKEEVVYRKNIELNANPDKEVAEKPIAKKKEDMMVWAIPILLDMVTFFHYPIVCTIIWVLIWVRLVCLRDTGNIKKSRRPKNFWEKYKFVILWIFCVVTLIGLGIAGIIR